MKKMNYPCFRVAMVFGLLLSLLIANSGVALAAKPAEKGKEQVEANITHIHHLVLRGAYSEMPSTSFDPMALVMGVA